MNNIITLSLSLSTFLFFPFFPSLSVFLLLSLFFLSLFFFFLEKKSNFENFFRILTFWPLSQGWYVLGTIKNQLLKAVNGGLPLTAGPLTQVNLVLKDSWKFGTWASWLLLAVCRYCRDRENPDFTVYTTKRETVQSVHYYDKTNWFIRDN